MQQGFEDIAFATPEKFRSILKMSRRSGMTARGNLAVSAGHMLFVVRGGKLEIRAPTGAAVVPVSIPWLGLALGNAVCLLLVLRSATSFLTPDNPLTWLELSAINILLIVLYRREKWVEIIYANEKGQPERAYFTPASQLGWWPSPEKVERLCEAIRSALGTNVAGEPTPKAPTAPAPGPEQGQESVTVVCEDCGGESVFLASDFGTVQRCPHCYAFVDVEEAHE